MTNEEFLNEEEFYAAIFSRVISDIAEAAAMIGEGKEPSDLSILCAVDAIRWLHKGLSENQKFFDQNICGITPQIILPTLHQQVCRKELKSDNAKSVLSFLSAKGLLRSAYRAASLLAKGGFEARNEFALISKQGVADRYGQYALF